MNWSLFVELFNKELFDKTTFYLIFNLFFTGGSWGWDADLSRGLTHSLTSTTDQLHQIWIITVWIHSSVWAKVVWIRFKSVGDKLIGKPKLDLFYDAVKTTLTSTKATSSACQIYPKVLLRTRWALTGFQYDNHSGHFLCLSWSVQKQRK